MEFETQPEPSFHEMPPGQQIMHSAADKVRSAAARSQISTDNEYILFDRLDGDGMPLGLIGLVDSIEKYRRKRDAATYIELGVPLETTDVRQPRVATHVGTLVVRNYEEGTPRDIVHHIPNDKPFTDEVRRIRRALLNFRLIPMREKLTPDEA